MNAVGRGNEFIFQHDMIHKILSKILVDDPHRISIHLRSRVGVYSLGQCQIACGAVKGWLSLGGVLIAVFKFSIGASFGYSQERMLSDHTLTKGGFMGLGKHSANSYKKKDLS